ncbi:MAG: hypothetical protein CMF25_01180 [Kangiellaceae bacterium]|nr:hypothetical protein [Kangiellaceae bacterium]
MGAVTGKVTGKVNMGFLARVSVKSKLALVIGCPLVMVLLLGGLELKRLSDIAVEGELAKGVVELSRALDEVAHHHAVERGLSAGYLGSGGSKGLSALNTQREKADKAENGLRRLVAEHKSLIDDIGIDLSPLNRLL